ncbi:MAG: ORF6N domain-containing protein [Arcobacter butzleri]|nr:ORF6N domain-containing protein [Aliarcobacter butzleri]
MEQNITLQINSISDKIYTIRGIQVMLDRDLAELYGVETKHINQAVKNNIDKFQDDFYFELSDNEFEILRSNLLTTDFSKTRVNPKVFTEQGVYMLATILKSKIATQTTVQIIRTFAHMRKIVYSNLLFQEQLKELQKRQLKFEINTDESLKKIFKALENNPIPTQGIFYNGQIFDAYIFINDILKVANKTVLLIDNYIDDTIFTLFSKYPSINFTIYTHTISKQLNLDYIKYQKQYTNIELKINKNFHDRFIILDDQTIYHIGASLKDLGKKVFAFSKMELSLEVFKKL